MQRRIVAALAVLALSLTCAAGCKKQETAQPEAPATTAPPAQQAAPAAPAAPTATAGATGEQLFKQYCAACHPDGGNSMNAQKTLHGKDLAANNVKTADDIVNLMRNPGPGMTKFDSSTISDTDAKSIADYILKTFK